MDKIISQRFIEDPKLLSHLKENSHYLKYLNRNPFFFKEFQNIMKTIYKERVSDKINSAIDGVEMISDVIDTIN